MALTKHERETIICFNESEPTAEIFTYNKRLRRELAALTWDRPDDVLCIRANSADSCTYSIPKRWVKIRPTRVLSAENRALRAALTRQINSDRKNNVN
ncbi:MAG: immunoglobulin [Eubacteriales bacterium]|nr:immunoglobulin [Eubacteriales bacterium]